MKKIFLAITAVFVLFSCTMETEMKMKSDGTSGFVMNFNLGKKILEQAASMGKMGKEVENMPKNYVNLYEYTMSTADSAGKAQMQAKADSMPLLKKMLFKGLFKDGQFSGMSMSLDGLKQGDLQNMDQMASMPGNMKMPSILPNQNGKKMEWDGNVLKLYTGGDLIKVMNESKKDNSETAMGFGMIKSMMGDEDIVFKQRYVFEKPIKKIKGKHDWVKKAGPNVLEFSFSFNDIIEGMEKGKSLKKADDEIIVELK